MKKCIYGSDAHCTALSDEEVKVPCIEGPCPYELLVDEESRVKEH